MLLPHQEKNYKLMLVLGWTFFALSSDYRKGQIDEFYYLSTLMKVSWSDFEKMPIFVRKYLLEKWFELNNKG
jgi:hypothetical protein